jgi:hypothetical protein
VGLMLGALRKPAEHVFENPGNPLLIIFSSIIGILIIIFFVFYKYHLKKDILNIS